MKFDRLQPPRTFRPVGPDGPEIVHVATIELAPDEQVTFVTDDGREVDFVRKSWGFYPVPSLNSRLPSFGLHPVLVLNGRGNLYMLLVEDGKRAEFDAYLEAEGCRVVAWLGESQPV